MKPTRPALPAAAVLAAALTWLPTASEAAPKPSLCPEDMPEAALLPPVVLVGGASGGEYFERLAAQMALCGWEDGRIFRYYREATGCVAEEAALLADYMNGVLATTESDTVDAMGYSLGGILLRQWLAFHGGVDHVDEVVLWGAPNQGSPYTQEDDPYCWMQEIHEASPVIQCLNGADPTCGNPYAVPAPLAVPFTSPPEEGIAYYNLWSAGDVFLPPSATALPGSVSVKTPAVIHTDFHRNEEIRRLTMLAFLRREAVAKSTDGCGTVGAAAGEASYAWLALVPGAIRVRKALRRG